jgi:hypothetical protein
MNVAENIINMLKKEVLLGYEWGFHSPKWAFNKFTFYVRGVEFVGKVEIIGRETNEMTITFTNSRGEELKRIHNVYPNELVDTLRFHIDGSESWIYIKQKYYIQKYYNKGELY